MIMGNDPVRAEVWPVAADQCGIWLCSGTGALYSGMLPRGCRAGDRAKALAVRDSLCGGEPLALIHSTGWRQEDDFTYVFTFIAVLKTSPGVPARECWPAAMPVPPDLLMTVGNPAARGPVTAPVIRYVDVLYHALRHLRFLLNTDSAAQSALTGHWPEHLAAAEPALAGMYQEAAAR